MKLLARLIIIAALLAPPGAAAGQPPSSADTPVFVAYYWRARPGKIEEYTAYIKDTAEAIDENARRAGVFEEVRTVTPAPGTVADWTHLRIFRLKNAAAETGARRRPRRGDSAGRAGRGQTQSQQRAFGRAARSGAAGSLDLASLILRAISGDRRCVVESAFRLAGVAQLVEQLIRNQQVTRSSRVAGSKIPQKLASRPSD